MSERILHPFPPLFDSESRTLILGSFPSVKSREAMFFYGHPQRGKILSDSAAPSRAVGFHSVLHHHGFVRQLGARRRTERPARYF